MSLILVDSLSESYVNNTDSKLYTAFNISDGQCFTGKSVDLKACKFYITKVGSPTGNVYAKIYNITGTYGLSGKPDGNAALAVSDAIDISTLLTTLQLTTFNFSGANQIELTDGAKYGLALEFNGGDSSNYLKYGANWTGGAIVNTSHDGNMFGNSGVDLTNWPDTYYSLDMIFYVYGEEIVVVPENPPVEGGQPMPFLPSYSTAIPDTLSIAKPISLKTTKIINGAWTANMQILPDDYIQPESYIDIKDNEEFEQYVVKKLEKIKSGGKYYYDVELILNAMEELTAHKVSQFYFQKSVEDCANFLLAYTGWTLGECDIDEIIILESGTMISSLEGLNQLVEKCNGELYWHSKDRIVDIKREIGNITGLQLRYDKNLTEIKKIEDSSGLVTRIIPMGPDNFTINTTPLDDCEDITVWTPSGGGSVALSSANKRQGSSAIEISSSTLNETFIRDLGAGSVKDLTGHTSLKFWIYSAVANALGFTFGIGESAYTEITVNTGALEANCWREIILDLSAVADASKNAIRYLGFKNLTGSAVTMLFDWIRAFDGDIFIDSANIGLYKVPKEHVYNHSAKPEKVQYEVIIYPSDDTQVMQEFPNSNYGSLPTMAAKGYSGYNIISHLKHSLAVLPNSAVIVSATLNLNCFSIYNGGESVECYLLTSDWNESTATYNNKPTAGVTNLHTFSMTAEGDYSADFKTVVENWFNGSVPNYGIKLIGTSTGTNKAAIISSKESNHAPYFKIVFTLTTDPSPVIEAAGRTYMAEWDVPYLSYSGKMHDLSKASEDTWEDETIGLGDTIKMYDSEIKDSEGKLLNVNIRVNTITRNLLSPTDVDIELANKVYTFADLLARIARQLKYAMPFEDNPRIINANAIQEGNIGGSVNV